MESNDLFILDPCCGSRMMWFDKQNAFTVFGDIRNESHILCDGRALEIRPDVQLDFRALPFADNSFKMVTFDPPHMTTLGANSWMAKKYGRLDSDWKEDIGKGFLECMRVLDVFGTLVFKWNTTDVKLRELLSVIKIKPVVGHKTGRQSKTFWMVFMKLPTNW